MNNSSNETILRVKLSSFLKKYLLKRTSGLYLYKKKGHPIDNEKVWLECYRNHNQKVLDYYQDRPEDLLIIDITKENPAVPFHILTNAAKRKKRDSLSGPNPLCPPQRGKSRSI